MISKCCPVDKMLDETRHCKSPPKVFLKNCGAKSVADCIKDEFERRIARVVIRTGTPIQDELGIFYDRRFIALLFIIKLTEVNLK